MARKYLDDCLDAFKEVTKKVYGVASDLTAIEASVAHLRTQRTLAYDDVKLLASPSWGFSEWWAFPGEEDVTRELKGREFDFENLPDGQEGVVGSLLKVFKSIELVSIILRFVRPDCYGIISPPLERLLEVRRESDAAKTYRNYINDLQKVAKRYNFKRIADADMALWVLHERCFGSAPDPATLKEYEKDRFLRRLRAGNLLGRFRDDSNYAQLAHSLLGTDHVLAGQLAGIEFEQMVLRRLAPKRTSDDGEVTVRRTIDELHRDGKIDTHRKAMWHNAWTTRNRAIHLNPPPDRADVEKLIEQLDLPLANAR